MGLNVQAGSKGYKTTDVFLILCPVVAFRLVPPKAERKKNTAWRINI